MLYFEDFRVGESVTAGAVTVSQEDMIAYASRFDAQDFHTDPVAARASFAGALIGSGWHSCSLMMRLMAETFIIESSSMGGPGVDEVKWLRPVRPGDALSLRRTVLAAKPSRSRPEMGLVQLRVELLGEGGAPVMEQVNWIMFGRRGLTAPRPAGDWLGQPWRYSPPETPSPLEPPLEAAEPARFFEELEIDRGFALGSFVFTRDEIVAFAGAFDPQPFHMDEEAAAQSQFGALIASGWHTGSVWMASMVAHRQRQLAAFAQAHPGRPAPRLGTSPGFRDLRWLKPVFAGDRISYHSRVVSTRASASRPQWGLFFHHNTGVNQRGETVFSFEGCAFVERRPTI